MAFEYLYKEYLNVILLSTLGTKYAKADFSNVITKVLSQNGYYKFPDGLLIQWGYASSGSYNKAVLLSTLGTNFAKSDFSNVITKSLSQNGYYKFPDGFLIQWGYFTEVLQIISL